MYSYVGKPLVNRDHLFDNTKTVITTYKVIKKESH